jgi:hypothetical protein
VTWQQAKRKAIEKQHIVKTSAATLNKSKRKEKDFFFSFRFVKSGG